MNMHKEVQMLKTTSELQEFILWAKEARIKAFKVAGVEVEFSDLAFIDAISEITPEASSKTEEKDTSKTMVDTLNTDLEDEDLLFYSAKR